MNRIVSVPRVVIEADGVPLPPTDVRGLEELRVQQRLSLPTLFELVFRDRLATLTQVPALAPGARLRAEVNGQKEPLFVGEVTAVEHVYGPAHGREVRIRGYDLLHRLRKRQTLRAYVQVTVLDLVRELVGGLGISVQASDPGPLWQRLIQHRPSDFDLLVEVAERCGLYFYLHGEDLHLLTLDGAGETVSLVLGQSLLEARIEVNGDPACRSAEVNGWDPLRVETHGGRALSARVGRDIAAEVPPARLGGDGKRVLMNQTVQDERQAAALAQAELDVCVAREVSLWGVAEGDARLRPGIPVQVTGVGDSLEGRYVLTGVTHTIDERMGFVSEISTCPAVPQPRATSTVATFGVVTRVDDPDKIGRIKVSLPTYGDVETEWMEVASPGAGHGKGLVTLPDVGDRVLVLFANGDPGQGIVLGGLYGVGGPPDSGVEGGAVRRYTFLTPGGQRIRLDDAQHVVHVENSQGSYVELSPERVSVHAVVDLQLEAPGKAVVIRGKSIDFVRA